MAATFVVIHGIRCVAANGINLYSGHWTSLFVPANGVNFYSGQWHHFLSWSMAHQLLAEKALHCSPNTTV